MSVKKQSPPRLSERQRRFAEAYARNGGNTERAALEAGYSRTYARAQAHRLLANIGIAEYLQELTAQAREQGVASALERQQFWATVMRDPQADMQHRLKASELLGRAQGDFLERVTGELRVRILDDDA